MSPFRLALLSGLVLGMPVGGWLLSLLAAAPDPTRLQQAAALLVLLQVAGVVLMLPGLGSGAPELAPLLLLFLIPAPLAVPITLAGVDPRMTVSSQLLGMLAVVAIAIMSWALDRLHNRNAGISGTDLQSLFRIALLVALLVIGSPLLAQLAK